MKILVAVKRVIDPYVKIRVKPDGTGVETNNVKMTMNPFDEIAVEEAIRLREKQKAKEVIIVSIGQSLSQDILRHGLALGADRAILVESKEIDCSLNIAKILQAIVLRESADLVLMGKQSIDGDNNQTPQMLAGLLDWSQATYASQIAIDEQTATVCREVDSGLETIAITLPAIISTDLRLNEPRYASLPNIMKAKQKPLQIIALSDLNLILKTHQKIQKTFNPPVRQAGTMVQSVAELVDKLQQETNIF